LYATKVSERVYLLDTFALGQPGTVGAYAIKGPKVTLIDCGYASSYKNVIAGLSEIGVSPSDVRYIIPTHVHLDHAGATGQLLMEMPNAEVISHERGVPHLVDPTRLIESATKVFGEVIMGMYGAPLPIPKERVTSVGNEANLDLGDALSATMIHTPGHAPHQISILLDRPRMLLTADAVGIVYSDLKTLIPTTPPPSFDPKSLIASVSSLEQMTPEGLLVPHFGVKSEVDAVFEDTKRKVPDWLRKVESMGSHGMALDDISNAMEKEVEIEAGTENLPIFAKVSVRSSVMGILHYLSKNV